MILVLVSIILVAGRLSGRAGAADLRTGEPAERGRMGGFARAETSPAR